jgi:hypothetical protein
MGSIVGENNYKNATSSTDTLAEVNASIASVTASLKAATTLYNEALAGIATCDNKSLRCVSKSGRHISTWREQRDQNSMIITNSKKQLDELLALQAQLVSAASAQATSTAANKTAMAQADKIAATAETAVAEASSATIGASAKKYLLYGGIGIGVIALIFGGIYIFKKVKKSK